MHHIVPRQWRDYLKKSLIQIELVTDESNGRNEIGNLAKDKTGRAVEGWLRVGVQLMVW